MTSSSHHISGDFSDKDRWMIEAFASVSDAIFVTDVHGRISFINPKAATLSGWSVEEAIGQPVGSVVKFSIDDDLQTVLSSSPYAPSDSPQEFTGRISLVKKDGSSKSPVKGRAVPFSDKEGTRLGTIILLGDATIEHRLIQAKDHFLSIVAHQLRTPLGSARWCMDMLLSGDLGTLSDEARRAIISLHASNQQMIELVNDLLDMAKFNRTNGVEESVPVDVAEVVESIFRFLELDAQRRRVVFGSKSDPDIPKLLVPRRRFYEVVRNLVSNAVKYSKPGGHVIVEVAKVNDRCRLSVKDDGIGIPLDEQQNIFAKFFRASNAVHSQTEGSGLGLAVVKIFVESWGGTVSFESIEGKGTTFFIELPLSRLSEKVLEKDSGKK
ncbi:MAG: ATP-binding protein [Candidatus Moraniibacteriota bacterium]